MVATGELMEPHVCSPPNWRTGAWGGPMNLGDDKRSNYGGVIILTGDGEKSNPIGSAGCT